jgi:uncharacterized protein YndB with AHSA1/START domain
VPNSAHYKQSNGERCAPSRVLPAVPIDLRIGGSYRLGMTGPDVRIHVAVGVYREVQRPMRRVFTWEWEDPTNRGGGAVSSLAEVTTPAVN